LLNKGNKGLFLIANTEDDGSHGKRAGMVANRGKKATASREGGMSQLGAIATLENIPDDSRMSEHGGGRQPTDAITGLG